MEKTIKIGKKPVRLSNNIGWTMEYRDQFGRDIIPAIMPAIAGGLDLISNVVREIGPNQKTEVIDVIKALDSDVITDIMVHMMNLELTDLVNITWAMAKAANEDIADPREWVKQFDDGFPLDVVAPAVIELAFKGMTSSKNLERLKRLKDQIKKTNQPESTSTQSSSQESTED